MFLTSKSIDIELRKTVVGQEKFLKDLSTAAWLHSLRRRHFIETGRPISCPKQNILCFGPSGSGKTLAVQTVGKILGLPVLVQDASALRGAGWISSIIHRAYAEARDEKDAPFCIVCLDKIDKFFRSCADSDCSALDSLLTFLCDSAVTARTENGCTVSLDISNVLVVCLGAFEGIDKITSRRLANESSIGFGSDYQKAPFSILQNVTEADLHEYGIPWEFLSRITLLTQTDPFARRSYEDILTESDASPIRQFDRLLFKSIGTHFFITDAAVRHISGEAEKSGAGAWMLANAVSEALYPAIYRAGRNKGIKSLILDHNSEGLFVSEDYSDMPGRHGIISQLPETERRLLESVPFSCMRMKCAITECAEEITKLSQSASALPPARVSAASCILSSAACLTLSYNAENYTMLDLYASVCAIESGNIINIPNILFKKHREFVRAAAEYVTDPGTAAKTARQMLLEYCSVFLEKKEQEKKSA